MTPQSLKGLESRLLHFLEDLLEPMGRSERRHWAQVYIQGLLLDGERKSIEPLAARVAGADVQALRQLVGQSPWTVEEVQRRLAHKIVDLLSEPEVWILDETAFPKAGEHSVGVARQYCGTLGKVANCQLAVSLHWSSAEASCPILWRLYLPRVWLEDAPRAAEVKVPPGTIYRSQTDLALEVIDQALAWELPRLPVVADAYYGNDFDFRQELRERQLPYAVQVEPSTVVWTEDPNLPGPLPQKPRGRPRKHPPARDLPPVRDLRAVAEQLPAAAWHSVTWRQGSRGPQRSRFAKLPVWAAHRWKREHRPRVREWLLVEWPAESSAPVKFGSRNSAPSRWTAAPGAHGQGALASGAGLPGVERRTGIGPLRRPPLAGLEPPRLLSHPGVCLSTLRTGPSQKKLLVRPCRRPGGACKSCSFGWRDDAHRARLVP